MYFGTECVNDLFLHLLRTFSKARFIAKSSAEKIEVSG